MVQPFMLFFPGLELSFVTVAGMGLCFRFVLNMGLIIREVFLLLSRTYTDARLFLHCQGGWEHMGVWVGDRAGTGD